MFIRRFPRHPREKVCSRSHFLTILLTSNLSFYTYLFHYNVSWKMSKTVTPLMSWNWFSSIKFTPMVPLQSWGSINTTHTLLTGLFSCKEIRRLGERVIGDVAITLSPEDISALGAWWVIAWHTPSCCVPDRGHWNVEARSVCAAWCTVHLSSNNFVVLMVNTKSGLKCTLKIQWNHVFHTS